MDSEKYDEAVDRALFTVGDAAARRAFARLFSETQALIDAGEIELVVLAERRLSCIYRLLVAHGMPELDGCLVVSDRILDAEFLTDALEGSVLIIDDTVILGSTLERMHRELGEKLGHPAKVMARAASRSTECAGFLFAELGFASILEQEPDEIKALSGQLVDALAWGLTPYLSDFPVSRRLSFDRSDWQDFLHSTGWHVVDVTAPQFDHDEIQYCALSLIPTDAEFARVMSRIEPKVAHWVEAMKVRLFLRVTEDRVDVVVVPLALVAPASGPSLNETLDVLQRLLRPDEEIAQRPQGREPSAIGQHLLLQMYLSTALLADFWTQLPASDAREKLDANALDPLQARLYFGDRAGRMLQRFERAVEIYDSTPVGTHKTSTSITLAAPRESQLFDHIEVNEVLWQSQELLAEAGEPEQPQPGQLTKLGLGVFHSVASIFGVIDRLIERPERAQIRLLPQGCPGFTDDEILAVYRKDYAVADSRTLNRSFTLRELTEALMPEATGQSVWSRSIVSLGIDLANDVGIVVPRTRWDAVRDVAYRSYRLGENAYLADQPLATICQREGEAVELYDALTSRARSRHYSVLSRVEAIGDKLGGTKDVVDDVDEFDRRISELVADAVPGHIDQRYEGTALDVRTTDFDAELTEMRTGETRFGTLQMVQIKEADQGEVREGTRFTWTVFDSETASSRIRKSKFRVHRVPPMDVDRMEAAAAHLGDLIAPS